MELKIQLSKDFTSNPHFQEAIEDAMVTLNSRLLQKAQEETPIKTGNLRFGWQVSNDGLVLNLTNDVVYASVQDTNTSGHLHSDGYHFSDRIIEWINTSAAQLIEENIIKRIFI